MVNVIPAPHHVKPSDDGSVVIDNTAWIHATADTALASQWLRDGLTRFSNITLSEQESSGVRISLHIDNVYEQIPKTMGVRPDGGAAHDEGYSITVTDGSIEITGISPEAVFRGATTLVQLTAQAADGGQVVIGAGTIMDAPRLAWRGLSFDTVRCFHPVETVKNVLDLMALYKLNVLHFHLTDSEGWRFQVENWPQLTEISGQTARDNRPGGYYTSEEFAEIVQYAADRYIRVVPEFDSPGHTASVIAAYPELATEDIRAMDPAMQYLHPNQPRVPELLRDVYSAMAEHTNGAYLHVGGDEAIAMDHDSFQSYIQMALPIARDTGKGVVAWQEAARGGLQSGDLMQLWIPDHLIQRVRNARENPPTGDDKEGAWLNSPVGKAFLELFAIADQDLVLALDQGANIIISLATQLYLDTTYPEPSADPAQEEIRARVGMKMNNYGNGTVKDSYDWDPVSINENLPVDRIAGVEAAIWCETIESADDLFFQLLPRLAGSAEKAWSDHREWEDHRKRLKMQPLFWDAMGLTWFKSSVVW